MLVLFGAAFAAFTFRSEEAFTVEIRPELVYYAIAAIWLLYGLKRVFWPAPVCLLYPEKVRVGKKEIFWDQIESCRLHSEQRTVGKGKVWVNVLVFAPKPAAHGQILKVEFDELSSKDRELLRREITARGVCFMPGSN